MHGYVACMSGSATALFPQLETDGHGFIVIFFSLPVLHSKNHTDGLVGTPTEGVQQPTQAYEDSYGSLPL